VNHSLLPCVETGPATASRSVIWLHGLGASGHDFEPMVPELNLPDEAAIRFVFPHAPRRPVTINAGMVMPAWYDIASPQFDRDEDATGIRQSRLQIEALLEREVGRGVPPDRIVLAGFSQGGAMALHTGLRHPEALAGIMVLSAYLPLADTLAVERSPANQATSVFMAHGEHDPVVPFELAVASRRRLEELGYHVEWHPYPMDHSVCLAEIEAIGTWLRRVLEV